MNPEWYPKDKQILNTLLDEFMKEDYNEIKNKIKEDIHGIIVPHAGYSYSGAVAGKTYRILKKNKKPEKAIVIGPSHYATFNGVRVLKPIQTVLGDVRLFGTEEYATVSYEHSVDNQIPFLQKINSEIEILPLVVGEVSDSQAKEIATSIAKIKGFYVFSSDLSHFLPYDTAVKTDKASINIIQNLEFQQWKSLDACGIFPLMIMMHLCKINGWKPQLLEYKNSGDVTGDKRAVVGYASMWF